MNGHHPHQSGYQKHSRGFTLIEVVVALGILAVVAITGSKASMMYMNYAARSETTQLAQMLAQNKRHEISLSEMSNSGSTSAGMNETVAFAGRQWQISINSQPIASSEVFLGADIAPKQLTIEVRAENGEQVLASSQVVISGKLGSSQ